ncbi:hypothetical protein [Bacillus rubiinfantis]|uniref:hypothetical protein n=1 Tax=Bacillus rubiinfantis TaxID=1499680 RepID=UPI0005A9F375|nr:hypothetical protein [Bacillus rubiinfantis]
MKTIFVISLVSLSLLLFVSLLDLLLGAQPADIPGKLLESFRLNEAIEMTILIIFGLIFFAKAFNHFIKKKQESQQ